MGEGPKPRAAVVEIRTVSGPQETYWFTLLPPPTGWRVTTNLSRTEIFSDSIAIARPLSITLVMLTGWIKSQKYSVGDEIGQVVLGFSDGGQLTVPLRLSTLRQDTGKDTLVVEVPVAYRQFALTSIKIVFTAYPAVAPKDLAARLKEIAVLALK